MAALLLHWVSSLVMVAVPSKFTPSQAYEFLTDLYSYAILVVLGCLVSGGLLYLKWSPHRNWAEQVNFKPWGGPTAAIVYW
jgi:L-asparagine transporter-like permease